MTTTTHFVADKWQQIWRRLKLLFLQLSTNVGADRTILNPLDCKYDYFGFVEIDAYVYKPYPDIVFMELEL